MMRSLDTSAYRALRLFAFSGLLLVVFGVWLLTLSQRSIWADEQSTLLTFNALDIPSVVSFVARAERRPPVYFILMWFWSAVTGTQEFALRYFSAWCALLSLPLTYALARALVRRYPQVPRSIPALTLLLALLSPVLMLYGVMVRYYALVLCLSLVLLLLGFRWLRAQPEKGDSSLNGFPGHGKRYVVAWLVVALLLVYADYSVLALLGTQLLWLFLRIRTLRAALWQWVVAAMLIAVLFQPQLALLRAQAPGGNLDADLSRNPLGLALKFVYPAFSYTFGETIFPWHPAVLLAAPFVAFALLTALRRSELRPVLFFSGLIVLLPLTFNALILTVIATDLTFLTAASRTLFVLPAFLLVLACALASLPARWRALSTLTLSIANVFALIHLLSGQQFHNPIFVVPLREVVQTVHADTRPGDALLADRDSGVHIYWQSRPAAGTLFLFNDDWPAPITALDAARPARIWLFVLGRDRTQASDHTDSIRAWLAPAFRLHSTRAYALVDPAYKALRDLLLQRDTYRAKLTVELYERR